MKPIKYNPIEEKDLNDSLVNLYGRHIPDLYMEMEKIYMDESFQVKPAAPLLIELSDEGDFPYEKGELKVMVFGRENNNWNDKGNRKNTAKYTEYSTYNFNLEDSDDILTEIRGRHADKSGNPVPEDKEMYGLTDIYWDYCYNPLSHKNQFSKRMIQLINELEEKTGKKIGLVWNNLFKIGRGNKNIGHSCGLSPQYIQKIEKETFDIVKKEIEILNPDVIIFMSGTAADNAIKEKLGLTSDFRLIDPELPNLLRIDIPGIKYAARTIHPSRKSNEEFYLYSEALIKDIKETFIDKKTK